MERKFKSLPYFPVKAADADGRIRKGICAVFGNVDEWGDRIIPGAFRKTINEGRQRAKHLWNHSFNTPPTAKILELKEVGRDELPPEILDWAPEASGGLMVSREYYKNNELSNWVLEAIDNDDIDEMSFGYDVIDSNTNDEEGKKIRNLTELKLYDTSDVLWGMNAATLAFGAKNIDGIIPPLGVIAQQILAYTEEIKSGRRSAANDQRLIEAIHQASLEMGCGKCLGIPPDEDEPKDEKAAAVRQEDTALSTQRLDLQKLQLEILR